MGCGSSSQPTDVSAEKLASLEGTETKGQQQQQQPTPIDTVDKVETFKQMTPSPSPVAPEFKKDHPPDDSINTVPTYRSNNVDDNQSELSYGSPALGVSSPPIGSPGSSLDPYQPRAAPALAPAYKLENEAKKIGGFDPEAFRKANQKGGFNSNSNQGPNDWATINSNNNSGGGYGNNRPAGGYSTGNGNPNAWDGAPNNEGLQPKAQTGWNQPQQQQQQQQQRDYIQSDDIFSTESPQAYQNNNQQRMDFRDDASNDPFRAPGGLGHQDSRNFGGSKHINNEDDALMDDILGELDDL